MTETLLEKDVKKLNETNKQRHQVNIHAWPFNTIFNESKNWNRYMINNINISKTEENKQNTCTCK
jgi:hypothetical protein